MLSGSILTIIIIVVVALTGVGMFIALLKRYKRCAADELLVISGKVKGGASAKVIHGGAAFVWPVIQEWQTLSLIPMSIDIGLKGALSSQNIRVDVPSSITFSISNVSGVMENAATHLLGLSRQDIERQASEIIFGQMRQVISNMSIEQINTDRDAFIGNIQTNLTTELSKIGLKLINVNVKDISDESGYIEAIGKEAAAKAINEASIKVAVERKKGEIGAAQADQVRRTEVSDFMAKAEIGEAQAASRNRIEKAVANAEAVDGENSSLVAIAKSDADRDVAQATADKLSLSAEKVQKAKAEEEGYIQQKITEDARALKAESTLKAD
jgi:flotillin